MQPNRRHATSTGGTTRVLYVDAEDPPGALVGDDDVAVSSVETAVEAGEAVAAEDGIDCVVSEYDLPDATGLDLLETVRSARPDVAFVVYTAAGSEALASEAIGMGATDYLPKDAGPERLRERVDRAVATSDGEAESGISGERMRELTNAFPDVAFVLDETGRYLEVLSGPETGNLRTVDREDLVGKRVHDVFPEPRADRFLDLIRTTLETGGVETLEYRAETEAGERWFEGRTAPLGDTVGGREAVVWVARDVTQRRENERELARSRGELERLNRINELTNSIFQSLVESATREEIERTVCEGLANSEFYGLAWIGGPWVEDDCTGSATVVGADPDDVARFVAATTARSGGENGTDPTGADGEPVTVSTAPDADSLSDRERAALSDLKVSAATFIPLSYDGTSHGVLGVGGDGPGTFGERELAALETLGEFVAFAIDAVKNRNLLSSDTAIELRLRVETDRSQFARISRDLGCRFSLDGLVAVSDDRKLEYVVVEGADPKTVGDRVGATDDVDDCRIVTATDDECLIELVLSWSGIERLLAAGTVVKQAVAEDGVLWYVVEASSDADVRSIVDSLRTVYPRAQLQSRREVDRPVHTPQEFRQSLATDLTDKQRAALRIAYFAGYYEYPRESTGEEVAESMGISSPTLHQHLQAAQRKLVGTFLEPSERDGRRPDPEDA